MPRDKRNRKPKVGDLVKTICGEYLDRAIKTRKVWDWTCDNYVFVPKDTIGLIVGRPRINIDKNKVGSFGRPFYIVLFPEQGLRCVDADYVKLIRT